MTVQVFENGILIWWDTVSELDGVLRRASNLASFHNDLAIQHLSADAQKVRVEITQAVQAMESKYKEAAAKKRGV